MATMKYGVDISYHQGDLTGKNIKTVFINGSYKPVEYAILRVGYRGYGNAGTIVKDTEFEKNYALFHNRGIPVGVYFYSQAITISEAIEEREFTLSQIKGKVIDYPVFIDTELSTSAGNGRADKLQKPQRTAIVSAFCNRIEERGYFAGIYASESWFTSKLNLPDLHRYNKWVAKWSSKQPTNVGAWGIWQISNSGEYAGQRVDVDCTYTDYPAIIRGAGLNGFSTRPKNQLYSLTVDTISSGDLSRVLALLDEMEITPKVTQKGD